MTDIPIPPGAEAAPLVDRAHLADAILSSSLDCIIVADDSGRIVEFNAAAERTFGFSRAEVIGQPMEATIVPHHHRAAHNAGMTRYLSGGAARVIGRRVEVEGLHASGRVFPVELSITETRIGGKLHFVSTLRDISEQKRIAADLLSTRASLQAIFDNIPAALYLRDRQDNLVMINRWGAEFLGRPAAEMIGQPMLRFRDPTHVDRVREIDDRIVRTGKTEAQEFIYRRPGGDSVGLMTFFPVLDSDGEVLQIGGILIDVTELHRAREDAQAARNSLQSFFDNVPAELYLREIDGSVIMANKLSVAFSGMDEGSIEGTDIFAFDRGDDAAVARQAQEELLATGLPVTREYHPLVGGREVVILNTIFPVRDVQGNIARIGGFSMEVTELYHARLALQQERANLQALFDQVPVGIHMNRIGPGGLEDQVVELANHNISEPYGLSVAAFINRNPYEMADWLGVLPTSRAFDARIAETHQPVHAELLNPTTGRYESYTRFPVLNAAGEITHIGGMVIDIDDRVRAEQQLEDVRAQLQSFYDNVPAELYIRELDGTFVTANAWSLEFYGISREDLPNFKAWSFDRDEGNTISAQAQEELLATGKPVTREFHQTKGEDLVLMNTIFPVRDAEGRITRIGGFSIDVSELYKARQALQQERANLQALFDQVPVGIHMNRIGPGGIDDQMVELANRNIAAPYGLGVEDFINRNPYEMADQDGVLPVAREFDARIAETRQPVHAEMLNPTTGRHESYTRFPVLNAAGEITHIGGMVIDIDDRVRSEERLHEAQLLLRTIFDNVPAALYLREIDGTVVMVNRFGAKLLGTGDADSLIGQPISPLDKPEDTERALAGQERLIATGAPVTQEYVLTVDGRRLVTLITIFPVRDTGGNIIRIGGFASDVTELYAARDMLEKARESLHSSEKLAALGQLLAGVAHELNNPLAVVLGRAAILQEKLANTPHAVPLQKLREAANRCARIVKTFLAMARQTGPRRQLVEVNELIESALEMTTYGLRSADIEWSAAPLAQSRRIEVDQDQIVQVLINLILNAQHAMAGHAGPRRVVIDTALSPDAEWVAISVADSGPGVPAAIANRIFEPFFTTKPEGEGTGLGLSVCKSMVEAHGGKLELLDTPGGGATFRVSLPARITGVIDDEDGGGTGSHPVRRARFLIVDDEVEIAAILADCLTPLGIECAIATNGQLALERIGEARFDGVFCDVSMPGMDGITFYHHLRERHPDLARRLVFVSGDLLHRNLDTVRKTVERPLIEKPFDPQLVRQTALFLLDRQGEV